MVDSWVSALIFSVWLIIPQRRSRHGWKNCGTSNVLKCHPHLNNRYFLQEKQSATCLPDQNECQLCVITYDWLLSLRMIPTMCDLAVRTNTGYSKNHKQHLGEERIQPAFATFYNNPSGLIAFQSGPFASDCSSPLFFVCVFFFCNQHLSQEKVTCVIQDDSHLKHTKNSFVSKRSHFQEQRLH